MEGSQRAGAAPRERESRLAGREGQTWRSPGAAERGGEMETCAAQFLSVALGPVGDPEESRSDRTSRAFPPSLYILVGKPWPLEVYLCRRILQLAGGFCHLWKTTQVN